MGVLQQFRADQLVSSMTPMVDGPVWRRIDLSDVEFGTPSDSWEEGDGLLTQERLMD